MAVLLWRSWLFCAAVLLSIEPAVASWPPSFEEPAVLLHSQLPEIIEGDWLARLDLFPGLEGLQRVRFEQAAWGGLIARLEIADSKAQHGLRVLVRSLARDHWDSLQERAAAILAREDPPSVPIYPLDRPQPFGLVQETDPETGDITMRDHLAGVRSWPEVPPPPAGLPHDLLVDIGPVPWHGRWLTIIDVGARLNLTDFNTFFTPMGQIGIAFGRGLSAGLVPHLGFYAGFGGMRRDFENAFGEGRANAFGFTLSTLLRQKVSDRQAFYLEGGGGYHIRSLYWDGIYYDQRTGQYFRGRVLEQQDWGWQLRVGWLRTYDHATRPRLVDIGFGVQFSVAEHWAFRRDDQYFFATDRDTWLVFSVRFWDGL